MLPQAVATAALARSWLMTISALDFSDYYIHLPDGVGAKSIPIDDPFWSRLAVDPQ